MLHLNQFMIGAALSTIFAVVMTSDDNDAKKEGIPSNKERKVVKPKKIRPRQYEEDSEPERNIFGEIIDDDYDDEDDDEDFSEEDENDDDIDPDEPMIKSLNEVYRLMGILDDALEEASNKDPDGFDVYNNFGKYYMTIIPYMEIINVTYQHNFVSELEKAVTKFDQLLTQFCSEFIHDEIDNATDISNMLMSELIRIKAEADIRIKEQEWRPGFEDVIKVNSSNDSDEIQAE